MRKVFGVALALVLMASTGARATVPKEFTVQGVLRNSMGQLQTMTVTVTATLFSAQTGGTAYGSPYTQGNVMAQDGLFSVVFAAPSVLTDLSGATEVWLEVNVDGEVYPRQKVTPEIYAAMCATADDASKLGGVAASSYLTQSAGDTRYLAIAATAADAAKLGGVAASAYITTATADGRYLGITATAADASALGGSAPGSYQLRVSGTCSGNSYIQTVNAAGTVVCGTAPGGTVTSVSANAPLSSSGGATPVISLTGTVGTGNGGNRFGGVFARTGSGAFGCPGSGTSCTWPNPLAGNNCACPAGFNQAALDQTYDGNANVTLCAYQCYQ